MSPKFAASSWAQLFRVGTNPLNTRLNISSRTFTTTYPRQRKATDLMISNTSIRLFADVPPIRQWRRKLLHEYRSVGLVPTMGALHSGHLSLIRLAAQENSVVVVSIYVNPAQFGVHEDFHNYPKTWEQDLQMLAELDRELAADGSNMGTIAAVFMPSTNAMYPSGFPGQEIDAKGSFVTITPVGEKLEARTRPTFFRGVATVCMKLLNIVAPERVYFGEKDIQQTVVLKKMVKDFCFDTQVVVGGTAREEDGLAMSSRNVYLGTRRRKVATILSKVLRVAEVAYRRGERSRDEILGPANELARLLLVEQHQMEPTQRVNFEMDYISLADPKTMEELDSVDKTRGAILSGAVKLLPVEEPQPSEDLGLNGGPPVRLIDNIVLRPS